MNRLLAFGLVSAASLYGQHRTWQDRCFNNPAAPYCMGHEDAIKPKDRGKSIANSNGAGSAAPLPVNSGGVDWRFADPQADVLAGFNLKELLASPLARQLIVQRGLSAGLTEADMKKKLDGLSGIGQVALSVRDGRILALVSGASVADLPPLEPGWKTAPVSGTAILVGSAQDVDSAVQRIAANGPLSELTRLSQETQIDGDFWAAGSGSFVGQLPGSELKRFSLAVSPRSQLVSDIEFEFNGVPPADTHQLWPALGDVSKEGSVVHVRTSMEADAALGNFAPIATSILGQKLTPFITAGRYLPKRDIMELKKTRPVIYGLDNGPRVVN